MISASCEISLSARIRFSSCAARRDRYWSIKVAARLTSRMARLIVPTAIASHPDPLVAPRAAAVPARSVRIAAMPTKWVPITPSASQPDASTRRHIVCRCPDRAKPRTAPAMPITSETTT